jgi:hypothetical protein
MATLAATTITHGHKRAEDGSSRVSNGTIILMTLLFRANGSANIRTMSLLQPTIKLQKIYKYKQCMVTMDSWKSQQLAMLMNSRLLYTVHYRQ